jgi:hypothetical protein
MFSITLYGSNPRETIHELWEIDLGLLPRRILDVVRSS